MHQKFSQFSHKLVLSEGWGVTYALSTNPFCFNSISHIQGIHKEIKTAETKGIYLNPIQKGGQFQFASGLILTDCHYPFMDRTGLA